MKVFQNYLMSLTILSILVIFPLSTDASGLTTSLGRYVNSEVGFELTFPNGWYTNDESSPEMYAVHGDPDLDWDAAIVVITKEDSNDSNTSTLDPNLISPGCNKLSEKSLSISGVSGFEVVIQCGGTGGTKTKFVFLHTENKSITILYDARNYEQYLAVFDSVVNSFKLIDKANDNTKQNQGDTSVGGPINNTSVGAPVNNTKSVMNKTGTVEKKKDIPSWIKNNAKWWSEGSIGDNDFVQGIQYLITHGIMKV